MNVGKLRETQNNILLQFHQNELNQPIHELTLVPTFYSVVSIISFSIPKSPSDPLETSFLAA